MCFLCPRNIFRFHINFRGVHNKGNIWKSKHQNFRDVNQGRFGNQQKIKVANQRNKVHISTTISSLAGFLLGIMYCVGSNFRGTNLKKNWFCNLTTRWFKPWPFDPLFGVNSNRWLYHPKKGTIAELPLSSSQVSIGVWCIASQCEAAQGWEPGRNRPGEDRLSWQILAEKGFRKERDRESDHFFCIKNIPKLRFLLRQRDCF